jgi:hypothetical protein
MSAAEQRTNITFCVLLHISPSETLQMLEEVYVKATMKKSQVYWWHKHGRVSVDDPQAGDAHGLAHYKLIPEECTVNKKLCRTPPSVRRKYQKNAHETAVFSYMTTHPHIGRWWSKSTLSSTM